MRRFGLAAILVLGSSVLSFTQQSGIPLALSERPGGFLINGATADGTGGLWITGNVENGLATTPDAIRRLPFGGGDVFLSHIGADGRLLYATYLGGTQRDEAYGIARDPGGNLYITGWTGSPNFPNTTGAVMNPPNGPDVFVAKLDPSGRLIVYSTIFGGRSIDTAAGIAVDAAGRAHVVGTTSGQGFPVTWGRCLDNWKSAFYVRLSPDGTALQSSTCLDDSEATAVTLDVSGDALVVGIGYRNFGPRMNPIKPTYPSGSGMQGFLAKISGNDTIPFSTYLGGSADDKANTVAVTSTGIYVGGGGSSVDYQGAAPRSAAPSGDWTGWISKVRLDGAVILGTTLIDGPDGQDEVSSLKVDASAFVHATGRTGSQRFPVSPDAAQPAPGGSTPAQDAFYVRIWAPTNTIGEPTYATYLGGPSDDSAETLTLDGSGGAWLAGRTFGTFPSVHANLISSSLPFVARFGQPRSVPQAGAGDVVLYAKDATAIVGQWQSSATTPPPAGGSALRNPDAGAAKVTVPAPSPANYFELTFQASAGVDYHLWLRMAADNDHWANDSVWAQFSDSVDASGIPLWQIGTASATAVSLEDCTNCAEQGWGWNDNGYASAGVPVRFATSGTHTIRIQQREDGVAIDQIVLSSGQWATVPPGASRYDRMILTRSSEPPPPADAREIALYPASDRAAGGTNWQSVQDVSAAGGAHLLNPDRGQAKLASPSAAGSDYFEVTFNAEAGVAYHLWIRSRATNDHWQNDSVFVQFSGSVNGGGSPAFRIGSSSATVVSLEDCSGCGEQGWGWNDNGYGHLGDNIYFAISGPQTIRVLRREDGIAIDQIVLSAGKYLTTAPGQAKNDTTIVPK
jgi:hypothetical protein